MNRRMIILLVVILLIIAGLVAFSVWLAGDQATAEDAPPPAEVGIVPVRSIYVAGDTNLAMPVGVGATDDGDFYVTLRDDQKVIEFDRDGDFVREWGERGLSAGQMMVPLGVSVDRLANHVYVTDRSRLRLICYDLEGQYLWEVPVKFPTNTAVGPEGPVVTTFGPVVMFDNEGQLVREFGSEGPEEGNFDFPRAIASIGEGDYVVADTNNTRIQRVQPSGEITATVVWTYGQPPRFQDDPDTLFGLPSGITVDDQDRVFVLDGFRHRIVTLDGETGEVIWEFEELEGETDGKFYLPTGIAHLYDDYFAVTDTYNDRVQIVRLLLPGENTLLNRNPWMRWLLLLLLLPLLWLFGRKRAYATEEALAKAVDAGQLRLLPAVYKKVHVLPAAYERFKDAEEDGVRIGEYLVPLAPSVQADSAEETLATAARPSGAARLLLERRIVVCADEEQADRLDEYGAPRLVTYDELAQEYSLKGTQKPAAGGDTPEGPGADGSDDAS